MYEVKVFGMDLVDVESEGGWQTYEKSSNADFISEVCDYLIAGHGEENVALYLDGELIEDEVEF